MSNKTLIKERLLTFGMSLGCYDKDMEKLSKKELDKVLDYMEYGSTDISVVLNKENYIVEVFHVENEVDFNLITPKSYAKQYGRIFNEDR